MAFSSISLVCAAPTVMSLFINSLVGNLQALATANWRKLFDLFSFFA